MPCRPSTIRAWTLPNRRPTRNFRFAARLLCGVSIAAGTQARSFDPYPVPSLTNDFGGVGLIQTPTARFAPDGQLTAGYNQVRPYDRYFVMLQPTSWLETTLRYTSVQNRLYSDVPEFSGSQTFKDRGFDLKLKLLGEGRLRPALAVGARDFIGTGLFSSEYLVASKSFGPFDASFGVGWGNLGTRGDVRNPFTLISSSFNDRAAFTQGGGSFNNVYFKGRRVAFFGGVQYATPIRGLTLKVEYDPNNYQNEALDNRFRVGTPINAGIDYRITSWLNAAASIERGNTFGFTITATTNFNRQVEPPKFDPPGAPIGLDAQPIPPSPAAAASGLPVAPMLAVPTVIGTPAAVVDPQSPTVMRNRLVAALDIQGTALIAANFRSDSVELFVAQTRFAHMATGLGRIVRSAFAVLPAQYTSARVVFVENGLETIAVTVPRDGLVDAVAARRGPKLDALLARTDFETAPLDLGRAEFRGPVNARYPQFYYSIRPGLKTTIGRPEAFVLYNAFVGFNGGVSIARGLGIDGQVTINVADNFTKLRLQSDSVLPRVRTDIAQYLRQGKNAIAHLQADYNFNIAPALYGHVYGGLLEQMFAGVGGELFYRPPTSNWAIGIDATYVAQREYDQLFDLRDYRTITGFVTGYYRIPGSQIDGSIGVGRYLAKDFGATFTLARTFDSGVRVGAFATFTDVSAADFGEGRFDKGIFLSVPLDLLYNRHVRSSIGIAYRPIIRDGGAQLLIRQPLIGTTDAATKNNFVRDWQGITR